MWWKTCLLVVVVVVVVVMLVGWRRLWWYGDQIFVPRQDVCMYVCTDRQTYMYAFKQGSKYLVVVVLRVLDVGDTKK